MWHLHNALLEDERRDEDPENVIDECERQQDERDLDVGKSDGLLQHQQKAYAHNCTEASEAYEKKR